MKSKKVKLATEHPATLFLNGCFYHQLKPLLRDVENPYEVLHALHLLNKEKRGPFSYLTPQEIEDYLKEKNSPLYSKTDKQLISQMVNLFSVVLGWKQFKQIYKFQPQLLEELWNIDLTEEKYETISRDEIEYLPCFNFFVELDIELNNNRYIGFFVNFTNLDVTNQGEIQVLFIADPKDLPKENGIPIVANHFYIKLLYTADTVDISSENKEEVVSLEMSNKAALRLFNFQLFEDLGEDKAVELIVHITQLISYLCASNADYNRIKKPSKKPDLKRNKITDSEYELWRLGDVYITPNKKVPHNYVDFEDDAYNRKRTEGIQDNQDNHNGVEGESLEDNFRRTRKINYHVRPHMRRAHWKYFWYGKKDGSEKRVRRRKFLSAVFINRTGEDIEIPTRETIQYRF